MLREEFRRRVGRTPTARSFVPAAVAGARAAIRAAAWSPRRGGACRSDMARPFLTVLTAPVPRPDAGVWSTASGARVAPASSSQACRCPPVSPYPGHYALVRSVVEGLRAIGADFNFNPRRAGRPGARRLRAGQRGAAAGDRAQATRAGSIIWSPDRSTRCSPTRRRHPAASPEIDRLIVAHEWALEFFARRAGAAREEPRLSVRRRPGYVETVRGAQPGRPRVVYWKSGDEAFCEQVERSCARCGLEPRRVRSLHGEHAMFSAGRLPATARRVGGRRVPEHVRNPGAGARRGVVDGRADAGLGSAGPAEWRGRTFDVALVGAVPDAGHRPAAGALDELEPVLRARARRPRRVPAARVGAREHDRRDLLGGAARDHPRRRRAAAAR